MPRRWIVKASQSASVAEAALDSMDADELRAFLRDIIPALDEASRNRLWDALIDRAARNSSGSAPENPTEAEVEDTVAFAGQAKRAGYATPDEVDDCLREGTNAFLNRNYSAARRIFHALLVPLADFDIKLGQHEEVDEVLDIDVACCAARYCVCAYMDEAPKARAAAVFSAIEETRILGNFWEPLREIEGAAIEALPEFEDFLARWRSVIEARVAGRGSDSYCGQHDWLREVVLRAEGTKGLARLARANGRVRDCRVWCDALRDARDWRGALAACEESAGLVSGQVSGQGAAVAEFLDGAALSAQELGRKDLSRILERAWRAEPSLARLRRWLGSSKSKRTVRARVAAALATCSKKAHRQRAFLHVLGGDIAAAAKLLSAAPGLGWSDADHPGHLLFPLFVNLLGGFKLPEEFAQDYDEFGPPVGPDEPHLVTPQIAAVLEVACVLPPKELAARAAMLKAMRRAAEKRIAGVVKNKRRSDYEHAASLALGCTRFDGSAGSARWLSGIRDEYRGYPALRRELGPTFRT